MFRIFKIYGKITNEREAEGTIKASMVIIMAIFILLSLWLGISEKIIPYGGIAYIGMAFFILKKQSKIVAIILFIVLILNFASIDLSISNIHTILFFIFIIHSSFKSVEATHKLKKYRNNIEWCILYKK